MFRERIRLVDGDLEKWDALVCFASIYSMEKTEVGTAPRANEKAGIYKLMRGPSLGP